MSFKPKDMHDVGKKEEFGSMPRTSKKIRIYYPNINLDTKRLPALKNFKFGDKVTIHAHGKISSMHQHNDEPRTFDIDLMKMGIKEGYNPRAKWMSDLEFRTFERCLNKIKTSGNKYAICMASVKKGRKTNREALKRTGKK